MTTLEFTKAVTREKTPLRQYAYQLTKNTDDADDLTQETMLKAFSYKDKFIDATNLKGWLFTIMKNSFINNYRRMVKRNTFLDDTDNTFHIDQMAPAIPNKAEGKFILRDIEKAIETLPYDLKNTFMLNYTGFKYHEIAAMLNIPIGTVKTRIFMARKALKNKLSVYGEMYGF